MIADLLALAAGFALPWLLGIAVVALATGQGEGRAAWIAGCGYFVGVFLLTVSMRLLTLAGIPFGVAAIALPLALATVALLALAQRRGVLHAAALRRIGADAQWPAWQRAVWYALIAWLAVRFSLLLCEVLLRPLFPWDAWTQWGTKARVWFELRKLVPFADASTWLAAPPGAAIYFDAAPHYPATVPLMQVYGALLIGRFDDALVNLPWWLAGVALVLAIDGALAQRGLAPLVALIAASLVATLPILNVHVALAGYADLAMSAYFTLAALAGLHFAATRRWPDALLALVLAVACVTIKNPGKAWVAIVACGVIVALAPRRGLPLVAVALAGAAIAAATLARSGLVVLGYKLQLDFALPWSSLADAYLLFGNWHLLWYGVIATALVLWRQLVERPLLPLTVTVALGAAFLLIGFGFTNAGAWVEDQSTVNRATLHLAPLLVVWMALAWQRARSSPARVAPVALDVPAT